MAYKTKEQQKEYNRQYWIKNKERIKKRRTSTTEYMREWREKNREKYNTYQRAYKRERRARQKESSMVE